MKLHPAQSQIALDTHRFRVIRAGRRFGKTMLAAYEMFAVALVNEDARVAYYAPTRDDARDIMWTMIQRIAEAAIIEKNETRLELLIKNKYNGQSLIALYGWEAVQERRKGMGVKNNFIVFDEVASFRNFWEGWNEVLRPTLTDLRGGAMFIGTPKGFNHFFDLCQRELTDPDYKTFHFRTSDNPFIPRDELERAKATLPKEVYAQEFEADFTKSSGLVFKEFNRLIHLYDELPKKELTKIAGIDFGYRNPAAVMEIWTDNENYWVENEFYKSERTESQIAEYVAACRFSAVYPDPESANGIEELRRRNVNVREVAKGKDSVKSGVQALKELFLSNRLKINRKCVNLISELEMYSYPDDPLNEKPIDNYNHAISAIRYAITTHTARYSQPFQLVNNFKDFRFKTSR